MLAKPTTWFCRLMFQFLEQGCIRLPAPVLIPPPIQGVSENENENENEIQI